MGTPKMASVNGKSNSPPGPFMSTVARLPGLISTSFWITMWRLGAMNAVCASGGRLGQG
jgi:hypothetical protein